MAVSYDNKIYSVVSVEKDLKSHSKKCFFSSPSKNDRWGKKSGGHSISHRYTMILWLTCFPLWRQFMLPFRLSQPLRNLSEFSRIVQFTSLFLTETHEDDLFLQRKKVIPLSGHCLFPPLCWLGLSSICRFCLVVWLVLFQKSFFYPR